MIWKTNIQRQESKIRGSKIHPLGPNQKFVQETDEYACLLKRIWWNLVDLLNRIWCSILVLSAAARIRLWSVGGIAAMYPCSLVRPHPAPRFRWRRLWGQVRSFDVKSISKYKWIYIEVSLLVLYVKDALPQGTKYYWEKKLESWILAPFYIFACFCPGANIWKSIIYRRSDIKVVEADQPVWRTFVHQSTRLAYDDSQPANLIKVNFENFKTFV